MTSLQEKKTPRKMNKKLGRSKTKIDHMERFHKYDGWLGMLQKYDR